MQRLGILSTPVYGDAYWPGPTYAGPHLWSLLYLDGDYYDMDITWDNHDDTGATSYYYDYFNVTTGSIAGDHVRVAPSTGLPTANGTYYSHNNYYGGGYYGSNFNSLNYGSPQSVLPFVYPDESYTPPVEDYSDNSNGSDTWEDYEEDYPEYYYWTDEEWEEFWEYLEEVLTPEEMAIIDNMSWEEFYALLDEVMSE
jgi:hypothetical protein